MLPVYQINQLKRITNSNEKTKVPLILLSSPQPRISFTRFFLSPSWYFHVVLGGGRLGSGDNSPEQWLEERNTGGVAPVGGTSALGSRGRGRAPKAQVGQVRARSGSYGGQRRRQERVSFDGMAWPRSAHPATSLQPGQAGGHGGVQSIGGVWIPARVLANCEMN